jgi:hypothetical protein
MFRTEAQQAAVCERLCAIVRLPGLWTTGPGRLPGPTDRAIEWLKGKGRGGTMSHGERLMFKAAWDVWNGRGRLRLDEALATLDGTNLTALGELLVALGSPRGALAIDEWLKRYGTVVA